MFNCKKKCSVYNSDIGLSWKERHLAKFVEILKSWIPEQELLLILKICEIKTLASVALERLRLINSVVSKLTLDTEPNIKCRKENRINSFS